MDALNPETSDVYRDALERVLTEWADFLNTGLRPDSGAVSEVVVVLAFRSPDMWEMTE